MPWRKRRGPFPVTVGARPAGRKPRGADRGTDNRIASPSGHHSRTISPSSWFENCDARQDAAESFMALRRSDQRAATLGPGDDNRVALFPRRQPSPIPWLTRERRISPHWSRIHAAAGRACSPQWRSTLQYQRDARVLEFVEGSNDGADQRLERRRLVHSLIEAVRERESVGARQRGKTRAGRFRKLLRGFRRRARSSPRCCRRGRKGS